MRWPTFETQINLENEMKNQRKFTFNIQQTMTNDPSSPAPFSPEYRGEEEPVSAGDQFVTRLMARALFVFAFFVFQLQGSYTAQFALAGPLPLQVNPARITDKPIDTNADSPNARVELSTGFEEGTRPTPSIEVNRANPEWPKDRKGWSTWDSLQSKKLVQDLDVWLNGILQGVKRETVIERLLELRTGADRAEKASIDKATEIRSAMRAEPPIDAAILDKLKAQLRVAVEEAFEARERAQRFEIISLTMELQKVLRSFDERAQSHSEIVDRRLDDLLNPNYRWDVGKLNQDLERSLDNQSNQSEMPRDK